jgi:hypothetical protein
METRGSAWLLFPALLLAGCLGGESSSTPEAAPAGAVGAAPAADAGAAPAAAPGVAPGGPAAGSAPIPAAPAAAPEAAPAAVLASTETNWGGIIAEVTEFRRRGNTLTAKLRLRNGGPERAEPDIRLPEVYLMDAANARKYEVLRDEKGAYIASLRAGGYTDRWYEYMDPGDQQVIWMKFPAPPAEVQAITLQLPGMPPFEDLRIDG